MKYMNLLYNLYSMSHTHVKSFMLFTRPRNRAPLTHPHPICCNLKHCVVSCNDASGHLKPQLNCLHVRFPLPLLFSSDFLPDQETGSSSIHLNSTRMLKFLFVLIDQSVCMLQITISLSKQGLQRQSYQKD